MTFTLVGSASFAPAGGGRGLVACVQSLQGAAGQPAGTIGLRARGWSHSTQRKAIAGGTLRGAITIRARASLVALRAVEIGVVTQLLANAAAIEIIEETVSAAEHGLPIAAQVVGKSDARRPIVLVGY